MSESNLPSTPLVSFVIATYGRPDALHATLRALTMQDHPHWEAIVVGDCCSPETENAIRALADTRIRYYNLPFRCGEQSGPNSFGLSLVKGDYMCYLNQDDLLLSDHLRISLQTMQTHDADLLFGQYAYVKEFVSQGDQRQLVITAVLPQHKDVSRVYEPQTADLDPSSFWLIRTAFSRRVGPWRPALTLWRTPISDWLMRAGVTPGRKIFGQDVIGLRMHNHNAAQRVNTQRPVYELLSPEFADMLNLIAQHPPETLRATIAAGFAKPNLKKPGWRHQMDWTLFKFLRLDRFVWSQRLLGVPKGATMTALLKYRTGETLAHRSIDDLLAQDPETFRKI